MPFPNKPRFPERKDSLRTSSLIALLAAASACSSLTAPPEPESEGVPAATAPGRVVPAVASAEPRRAPPPAPSAPAEPEPRVGASHILIAYKGASRAAPTITRTKEEARKRAEQVLKKAKAGKTSFEDLVKQYSDEPGAAARGGALGVFPRSAMVKPFADAAFALKPGEISGIVETEFGFHVIKRTQ